MTDSLSPNTFGEFLSLKQDTTCFLSNDWNLVLFKCSFICAKYKISAGVRAKCVAKQSDVSSDFILTSHNSTLDKAVTVKVGDSCFSY